MFNNQQNYKDREYQVAFNYFAKIGPINLRRLESYFSNLSEAFWANSFDLTKAGINSKIISEFLVWRNSFCLEKALEDLSNEQINFVTWHDETYPQILKEIFVPPPILYFKGLLNGKGSSIEVNNLAVVGSRKHSTYAEKVISELLPPLIKNNITIVSGLALGVDSLAHQTALKNRGITLAVLGSGLSTNYIYPRSNFRLAQEIIESGGALISEFPPKTPPLKQNFPQRNRIISGLSQATLVIESKEKSGSLITANFALEQNREVAAIPGNIFSEFSAGPNNLISKGAKLIKSSEDILEIFQIEMSVKTPQEFKVKKNDIKNKHNYKGENTTETLIYQLLLEAQERAEKITADEIIKKSKLDTAIINSTLSILEIKGLVKNDETGYYLN